MPASLNAVSVVESALAGSQYGWLCVNATQALILSALIAGGSKCAVRRLFGGFTTSVLEGVIRTCKQAPAAGSV